MQWKLPDRECREAGWRGRKGILRPGQKKGRRDPAEAGGQLCDCGGGGDMPDCPGGRVGIGVGLSGEGYGEIGNSRQAIFMARTAYSGTGLAVLCCACRRGDINGVLRRPGNSVKMVFVKR